MKNYELTYSNKATINTGDYSNENPMFAEKLIITVEDGTEIDLSAEFQKMKDLVDSQLYKAVAQIKNRGKETVKKDFRYYEKDGKKYVSVTTVITPEMPDIPNLELYGLRGTILHRIFERMVTKAEYLFDVTDEEREKLKVIGGMDNYKLSWIMQDKRFDFRNGDTLVYNDEYLYAGRYDALGFYVGKSSLFDLKSGKLDKASQEKAWTQMAAYNGCLKDKVEQLVIIPGNPKEKQEGIVSTDINKYMDMFLAKRKEFKTRFGV